MRRLLAALGIAVALAAAVLLFVWLPLFEGEAPQRIDRETAARGAPAPHRVVLVSVDGLAPWVMRDLELPTLARLSAQGLHASLARTVLPAITLTSHASMLSGLPPAVHGVTWNRYEPWRHFAFPTVFRDCREAELRCGLFAAKPKFAHFAEDEPGVELYVYTPDAQDVLQAAGDWLLARDGDLAVVHLAEVDLAGHEEGWGSPAQRAAIREIDGLLGAFLARVAAGDRPLAVLVTSDHGGLGTTHGDDRPESVEIPWLLAGEGLPRGETAAPVSTLDTAPVIRWLLGVGPTAAPAPLALAVGAPP